MLFRVSQSGRKGRRGAWACWGPRGSKGEAAGDEAGHVERMAGAFRPHGEGKAPFWVRARPHGWGTGSESGRGWREPPPLTSGGVSHSFWTLKFLVHTFVKRQTSLDRLSAAVVYQTWTTSLSAASLPNGSVSVAPLLPCGRDLLTCDGQISLQPLLHPAAVNLCPFSSFNQIEMLCCLKIGKGI